MNWDNQNKDPWGNNNDATDFDDLVKKFSSILGASNKKQKNSKNTTNEISDNNLLAKVMNMNKGNKKFKLIHKIE